MVSSHLTRREAPFATLDLAALGADSAWAPIEALLGEELTIR